MSSPDATLSTREPKATEVKAPRATIRDWSTAKLTRTLRIVNMCNGALLITTGILCLLVNMVAISFASVTVSAYVVFFGCMLTCLECNMSASNERSYPLCKKVAPRFQKNFGFMYSFVGRSLFIFFAGTMTYALAAWLSWVVGSLTLLNGFFNGYIICIHPAFKTGELTATGDPYGGYTGGETEMLAYLKKNPQLAQKAGTAAANFARDNPEVAQQALSGAAGSSNPWGGK